jgi:hypothetical protein
MKGNFFDHKTICLKLSLVKDEAVFFKFFDVFDIEFFNIYLLFISKHSELLNDANIHNIKSFIKTFSLENIIFEHSYSSIFNYDKRFFDILPSTEKIKFITKNWKKEHFETNISDIEQAIFENSDTIDFNELSDIFSCYFLLFSKSIKNLFIRKLKNCHLSLPVMNNMDDHQQLVSNNNSLKYTAADLSVLSKYPDNAMDVIFMSNHFYNIDMNDFMLLLNEFPDREDFLFNRFRNAFIFHKTTDIITNIKSYEPNFHNIFLELSPELSKTPIYSTILFDHQFWMMYYKEHITNITFHQFYTSIMKSVLKNKSIDHERLLVYFLYEPNLNFETDYIFDFYKKFGHKNIIQEVILNLLYNLPIQNIPAVFFNYLSKFNLRNFLLYCYSSRNHHSLTEQQQSVLLKNMSRIKFIDKTLHFHELNFLKFFSDNKKDALSVFF